MQIDDFVLVVAVIYLLEYFPGDVQVYHLFCQSEIFKPALLLVKFLHDPLSELLLLVIYLLVFFIFGADFDFSRQFPDQLRSDIRD